MGPSDSSIGSASSRLPAEGLFDAHCHLFNLEYLVLELGQILWDMLRGAYPRAAAGDRENSLALLPELGGLPLVDGAEDLLSWAVEIGLAAFGSEAANAARLRAAAKGSWGAERLGIVPLMMDIYYLFAPPLREAGSEPPSSPPPPAPESLGAAKAEEELAARIGRAVERAKLRAAARAGKADAEEGRKIDSLRVSGLALSPDGIKGLAAKIAGGPERTEALAEFKGTAGFDRHFKALRSLGGPAAGVYPFLAVDPRRAGILEWAMKESNVGPKGIFRGVKLYPRLGVHPACAELRGLYAHCAAADVPIVTHASSGGFPDWMESYAEYCRPRAFEAALAGNPGLRVDLAHFGNGNGAAEWGAEAAAMIAAHPGAFSDLSCYTRRESIERYKREYSGLPGVKERTMYGSDFDVMYFTRPGVTLEEYMGSFLEEFGPEELARMAGEVPRKFLGA